MKLTRPYNIGGPIGRRCPKTRARHNTIEKDTTEGQYGVPESISILRLKGGEKSSTGDSESNMDVDKDQAFREERKRSNNLKEFTEIVTPPSKKHKENSGSPNSPVTETEKTHSFHDRSRLVLRYFEKFKLANKKKLTAVSQQELDRGVDLVSDLLTEVCAENMIIYGRYLKLKEKVEDKKKKVEFLESG